MKRIFLLNGVVEFLAGSILFLRPDVFFAGQGESPQTLLSLKMYGILAMAFGGLSLVLARHGLNETALRFGALVIIVFHLLIGFQAYGAYMGGYLPNVGAFVLHLALAIICVILYLQEKK